MTAFDKEWWLQHGATYKEEFQSGPAYAAQEEALINLMANLRFESIIEVGAGFGRLTRLIHAAFKPSRYLATDVSWDALDQLNKYMDGSEKVSRSVRDLDSWDPKHESDQYDIALCAEVMMHRTPVQVKNDVKILAQLAEDFVINIDWYEPSYYKIVEGCFQHDYLSLFEPYGKTTRYPVPEARQAIWLTTLK